MRQRYDRQIRLFGKHTSRRLFNIAPATPLPKGRGLGWLFVVVFVLSSCMDSRFEALLHQADSLMTANPDSAWTLLSAVDSADMQHQRRSTRMRYELLRAEAQNKLYIDFTTDSVMREVVAFYDRWGSDNERLKAHYLLGCCYRDMHEAPVALLTWEDAVACADTTAADCDYATLFRIYGQMASIYFRQFMPEKELAAREKLCRNALLAGDTLNYIRGLLLRNDAYLALGDTAIVFENIEYVRQLYLERGLTQQAAQVYPSAIHIALDRGEYEKADSMMQIFEEESGLFDSLGNIAPTREIYYYRKGAYFLGTNQSDLAERQFRRLLSFEPNLVDAYRGLCSLYLTMNNKDSIHKYTTLYEDALVQYLDDTQIQATSQSEGMYDYCRQQHKAEVQKKRADVLATISIVLILIFGATIMTIFKRYRKAREQERRKQVQLRAQYSDAIQRLAAVKREISLLQRSTSKNDKVIEALKKEKEDQAHLFESQIGYLKSALTSYKETQGDAEMKSSILGHFHTIAKPHIEKDRQGRSIRIGARPASEAEWNQLLGMTRICYPRFYAFITDFSLSELRLHVCLLSRFGFENKDILTLANSSSRSVTNARIALAKQLFGLNSAKELDSHLKDI